MATYAQSAATTDDQSHAGTAKNLQPHILVRRAIALVLAGGRGSRLKQLTDNRAKPAVYFGGKFRIIDFALSNCVNSGIRRIGVVTQYKSHSLLRHLQRGWSFLRAELNEMVDLFLRNSVRARSIGTVVPRMPCIKTSILFVQVVRNML